MKEENEAQDPQLKELLALLLADKAREIKERNDKEDQVKKQRIDQIRSEMEAAQTKNAGDKLKREGCLHQTVNAATNDRRSAWRGQVNSDGTYSPVCCICNTEMPKIKATDHQKKEGVELGKYIELTVPALERMHKASYPDGCERSGCYVCFPVREEVLVG